MNTQSKRFDQARSDDDERFDIREAVAIFPTEASFLWAVDSLLEHGFDRADLSVLAHGKHAKGRILNYSENAQALADDGNVPRGALVGPTFIAEAKAASVGLPVFVGSIGGFMAAAATGGALAFTIPMAIAGGLAGGSLGALGAAAISQHHRKEIERQLVNGGILLWVRTVNADKERIAAQLLDAAGGKHVHVHKITIHWGKDDIPLAHVNPDPLLERGPDYD